MEIVALLNSKPREDDVRAYGGDESFDRGRPASRSHSESEGRQPIRLPGLEELLKHNPLMGYSAAAPNSQTTTLLPAPDRRRSFPSTSPYQGLSAATSPALSSASTAMTTPPPTSPPVYKKAQTAKQRRKCRDHRPTYQAEEEHFIWYHRIDLNLDWQDIRQRYTAQFPNRVVRGHQGIQCKYYRCTDMHGIPKCRERERSSAAAAKYGLRAKLPDEWYPWMREPPPHGATLPPPSRQSKLS